MGDRRELHPRRLCHRELCCCYTTIPIMCPREESNLYSRFRKPMFCPLNYEGIFIFIYYHKFLPLTIWIFYIRIYHIGVWCNGSTNRLGRFSLGSNPSTPTQKIKNSLCGHGVAAARNPSKV